MLRHLERKQVSRVSQGVACMLGDAPLEQDPDRAGPVNMQESLSPKGGSEKGVRKEISSLSYVNVAFK